MGYRSKFFMWVALVLMVVAALVTMGCDDVSNAVGDSMDGAGQDAINTMQSIPAAEVVEAVEDAGYKVQGAVEDALSSGK